MATKRGPQQQHDITGADVYEILKDGFEYGRALPYGRNAYDYNAPARAPTSRPPTPGHGEYRATYQEAKNSPVSPAPDESAVQFVSEKVADHNDTKESWPRGFSPPPHLDNRDGIVSGYRYSTKVRR